MLTVEGRLEDGGEGFGDIMGVEGAVVGVVNPLLLGLWLAPFSSRI